MNPLPDVGSKYGASMGRSNEITDPETRAEFEIERLRWVDGAYDQGGAYWGRSNGDHIFRAEADTGDAIESVFVRARTLDGAREAVLALYPNASFSASADLDSFLAAYQDAALWSSHNDRHEADPDNEREMLDDAGYDWSAATEATMREDCEEFLAEHGALISQAISGGYTIESAGHDFWLTRNHHGAGFWDRGLEEIGRLLTDAAHGFGEVDLYVGDDDLVHQHGERTIEEAPSAPAP